MSKRALVADNDFFFVEFLSDLLEENGYHPIKAYDGQEGMEKLRDGPVSVMFADVVMPKVDGPELIQFARQKYPDKPFPIVVISGTIIEQLDELDTIGADYYIPKGPMEKMRSQLEDVLQQVDNFGTEGFDRDSPVGAMELLFPRRESVELLESIKYQKAIIEQCGVGVALVDREAKILSVNPMALRILNRSRVETMGEHVLRCFPAQAKNILVDAMKTVAKKSDSRPRSVFCRIDDRRVRIIVSSMRLDGRFEAWIMIIEEVEPWEEPALRTN